jgi:hypothetical protein
VVLIFGLFDDLWFNELPKHPSFDVDMAETIVSHTLLIVRICRYSQILLGPILSVV